MEVVCVLLVLSWELWRGSTDERIHVLSRCQGIFVYCGWSGNLLAQGHEDNLLPSNEFIPRARPRSLKIGRIDTHNNCQGDFGFPRGSGMASECEVKEQLVWNVGIQVFLLTSQHLVSTTVRFLHEISLNSVLIAQYVWRGVGKDHLTPTFSDPSVGRMGSEGKKSVKHMPLPWISPNCQALTGRPYSCLLLKDQNFLWCESFNNNSPL